MNTMNRRSRIAVCALASILPGFGPAWADPQGGKIVGGSGSIRQTNGSTMVTQTSPNLSLNWSSFNLDPGQNIRFVQPDSRSIALNRISGLEPSRIFGQLNANGQVFLINPNGILFGKAAQVNVGALVASSHDISDADFAARRFRFESSGSGGSIVNQGQLNAFEGGSISLLGQRVSNQGIIRARLGQVTLASGQAITLDLSGDGLICIAPYQSGMQALVSNPGRIEANGGQVWLSAHSASTLLRSVVNQDGVIEATSLPGRPGKIMLDAGTQGTTQVSGSLLLQGAQAGMQTGTPGGELTVVGKSIDFGSANISAAQLSATSSAIKLGAAVFNISNSLTLNADRTAVLLGAADTAGNSGGNGGNGSSSSTDYTLSQADISKLQAAAIPNIAIAAWGAPMILAGPLNLAGSKLDLSADSFSDGNTQNRPISAEGISFRAWRGNVGASGENNAIDVLTPRLALVGNHDNQAFIKAAPGALQLLRTDLGQGTLALEVAGPLTQAGPLVAGKLNLINRAGASDLGNADNHLAAVGAISQSGGALLLRNQADNLLLGPITADTGLAISNSGSITVNQPLSAGYGNLSLLAIGSRADIVLNAGVKASLASAGMITLSAGGNFINHADARAVNPGLGNFVIFSTHPSHDITDGILPGFVRYGQPQNTGVSQSGNGFVYAQDLPLPTKGPAPPPGHPADLPPAAQPDSADASMAAAASPKGPGKNPGSIAQPNKPNMPNKPGPQWPAASTPTPAATGLPAIAPANNAGPRLASAENPHRPHLAHNPQAFKAAMKKLRAEEAAIYKEAIAILQKNPHVADVPRCSKHSGRACIPRPVDLSRLPPNGQHDIKRRVAYLIGNNDYSGKIAKLTTPINDVTEIGQILQRKFGYEVHILTNASREQMIDLLKSLSENHQPDESVLLFYAGHGKLVSKTNMAYWIPVDASSYRPDSWLSNSDINHFLAAIPARQVLLVSDSCYSGTLVKEMNLNYAKSLKREQILARRSVTVISSGGEELVSDAGKEQHSIFAWNFIEQLRQTKDNTVGAALFEKISQGVRAEYPQRPRYGTALNAGHMGGDFLLDMKSEPPQ
jgi:filamentous hemagglutinin family protein